MKFDPTRKIVNFKGAQIDDISGEPATVGTVICNALLQDDPTNKSPAHRQMRYELAAFCYKAEGEIAITEKQAKVVEKAVNERYPGVLVWPQIYQALYHPNEPPIIAWDEAAQKAFEANRPAKREAPPPAPPPAPAPERRANGGARK